MANKTVYMCWHYDVGLWRGTMSKCWWVLGWREKQCCHSDDNDTGWHVYTRMHVLLGENIT